MPRPARRTPARFEKLTDVGRHPTGEPCLMLLVRSEASRQWVARVRFNERRHDIHIGPITLYTFDEAIEATRRLRRAAREGEDPRFVLKKPGETPSFETAARRLHQQLLPTWKNENHRRQWLGVLERFAFPRIGGLRLDTLETRHVLEVLEAIWLEKPETARRVKQRMNAVVDWGKAAGFVAGDPMAGVSKALARHVDKPEHHKALPWRDLPVFIVDLRDREALSARLLEFLILTAARSGEAREAVWAEIDLNDRLWTIPAERMKMERTHRVPLSQRAIALLRSMRPFAIDPLGLVFPGHRAGKPFSDKVFQALFNRMGHAELTAHGFRSTFRDWCADTSAAPREVGEAALSHPVANKVEAAYARTDHLDQRRALMDAWSEYAGSAVLQRMRAAI